VLVVGLPTASTKCAVVAMIGVQPKVLDAVVAMGIAARSAAVLVVDVAAVAPVMAVARVTAETEEAAA
jgi:hypothetical protein